MAIKSISGSIIPDCSGVNDGTWDGFEFIEDKEKIAGLCRKLSYRFTQDESYIENELKNSLAGTLMFSLSIEDIQGKYVTEK